ncbi:MAG: alpha/beta hydrolase [Verrucomicrobiaceae bacterium]|nr:MAG: alpha/beta hydrolase [Verrucomicrobiaceae bacterium]
MRPLFLILLVGSASAQTDPFATLDTNRDGKVSAEEVPEALRGHFKSLDADSDGFVSRDEASRRGAPTTPAESEQIRDVDYVGNNNPRQTLDLLVPKDHATKKRPLVVFIHGGAWNSGKKEDGLPVIRAISTSGHYVTATLNYRLSQEAAWPAQIHDCKAAIRFLRGKADDYGIDAGNIGVIGISAGGHLVSMLGTCGTAKMLEGDQGPFPKESSQVQCVINFFGPTNFLSFSGDPNRPNAITALLGGPGPRLKENAKEASPVTWVTSSSAPFLTAHGTNDNLVPYTQAEEIHNALVRAGVESHLIKMQGAGHGFMSEDLNQRIRQFLDNHLRQQHGAISGEPIMIR